MLRYKARFHKFNLLTILPTLAHIFRLWTNRFLVHWTHLLVDFCIRKSHGFYSVRLLIFIQLFSSPHYIATGVPFLCTTFEKNFIYL